MLKDDKISILCCRILVCPLYSRIPVKFLVNDNLHHVIQRGWKRTLSASERQNLGFHEGRHSQNIHDGKQDACRDDDENWRYLWVQRVVSLAVVKYPSIFLTVLDRSRKWKLKLKEWEFDKKLTEKTMKILVAKAEKRAREGKETVFYHGGSQIASKKIERFKRQKLTTGWREASPTAGRCLVSTID